MTPFGGAISNYLHSWRLSNDPPGAVCSLLIWERWICTTNSFAWPSRASLSRPQPNLSTLNLNYFLPHTLTSNQAEPLIISTHTRCATSHPCICFCLCLEWPSSYHHIFSPPSYNVQLQCHFLQEALLWCLHPDALSSPNPHDCLLWAPFLWEGPSLLSDHELFKGTVQSHSHWFLSQGLTCVFRVRSLLNQWTDKTIIYVSQIYN